MVATQTNPNDAANWTHRRIKDTLLRNPAVGGIDEIAELIIASGSFVAFTAGDEFIKIGPSNDDVYFLLSGMADVHLADGRHVCRTAPTQVGEMAVLDRGSPRSACVRAAKGGVAVWKVDGDSLCDLFTKYPDFKDRMRSEMADRHRELAASISRKSDWGPVSWTILSISVAGLVGCIAWWIAAHAGATIFVKSISSVATGILGYVFVSGRNPAFFWRRMIASLVVFGMAMFGLQREFKFVVANGDQVARVELSSDNLFKEQVIVIAIIFTFLVLFLTFAILEYKREKRS